jgi:hypothetical protein
MIQQQLHIIIKLASKILILHNILNCKKLEVEEGEENGKSMKSSFA